MPKQIRIDVVFAGLAALLLAMAWAAPDWRISCLVGVGLLAVLLLVIWVAAKVMDLTEDPY